MLKPSRVELANKVVKLANLPLGRETEGYLSRNQLIELVMYLESLNERLRNLLGGGREQDAQTEI